MKQSDIPRAVKAAVATASAAGLNVDDAAVIHASNRIAVRMLPAGVLARVAYEKHQAAEAYEVEVARRLAEAGCPVGTLDARVEPRVHLRDGFAVTLWTYYEPLPSELAPAEYAEALLDLHAGLRQAELSAPRFTDRVAWARTLVGDNALTPDLNDADRRLLIDTLDRVTASVNERGAEDQLLHGEPHPGNLLNTQMGPLFIDLETCCRGPVEFDIVHAPEEVAAHYRGLNEDLLIECRILMLALIITWRWEIDDQLPNGRQLAAEWTAQMREELERYERLR